MSVVCLLCGTISRLWSDHAGTLFGLALLPDQLELAIFEIKSGLAKAYVYEVSTFGDNVRAMF